MTCVVITGASSGIGLALTAQVLWGGGDVVALVRDRMPSRPDLDRATRKGRLRVVTGDLADADSRRRAVAEIAATEPTVDVLYNNAGVSTGTLQFSPQARELHFEVNTVAPYVLTQGLSRNLAASGHGHVVNTVSDAFRFLRHFDPERLARPSSFTTLTGPYASSKLALALWGSALAPASSRSGITIVSVGPGPNNTQLIRGPGFPALLRPLAKLISKPASYGARLLFEASQARHDTGSFVNQGQVRPLPFEEHSQRVLELVAAAAATGSSQLPADESLDGRGVPGRGEFGVAAEDPADLS